MKRERNAAAAEDINAGKDLQPRENNKILKKSGTESNLIKGNFAELTLLLNKLMAYVYVLIHWKRKRVSLYDSLLKS